MSELEGTKHDGEKVRLDLLSTIWINGVGSVLTFGAKKYSANNWRKGIKLSRLLGAALRHIFAFLAGEDKDPESGLSHLYHASCCIMFAAELYETKSKDVDDRWKGTSHMKELSMEEFTQKCKEKILTPSELNSQCGIYKRTFKLFKDKGDLKE